MSHCIGRFDKFIEKHKGRNFLIAGTGRNTGIYIDKIKKFITDKNPIVIGMNSINRLLIPDYHLFTNNDRIKNYINEVDNKSTLLIGSHINKENLPDRDYALIKYTDRNPKEKMEYKNGVICGYYRVSGLLAVMIAHLMGAKKIYITGKDGYADTCKKNNGRVHFHDDDRNNINNNKTAEEWKTRYDEPMLKVMHDLRNYGINFSIITPTVFKEFYENTLCISE